MVTDNKSPWHSYPKEKPQSDGKYLCIISRYAGYFMAIRVFRNNDFIFTSKTTVEYWMEIPKTPIPL